VSSALSLVASEDDDWMGACFVAVVVVVVVDSAVAVLERLIWVVIHSIDNLVILVCGAWCDTGCCWPNK
jgi:uncharacterized membrane protein